MPTTAAEYHPKQQQLTCKGEWDISHLHELQKQLNSLTWPTKGELIIEGGALTKMDSAGAWLLTEWVKIAKQQGLTITFNHFAEHHQKLLGLIEKRTEKEKVLKVPTLTLPSWLIRLGQFTMIQLEELRDYLNFTGHMTTEVWRLIKRPDLFRWSALAGIIQKTGCQALPIIGLLSFMIGIVLAYQMGVQLRNYGANIFIVNLLGLSVLREFGPLLTAIMVAGRTGSAFTAQLGIMKINQEIDALNTMGITPGELLILPRIFGLLVTLPLLTVWADIFGIFGGMIMANSMLGISWDTFLQRFQHEIPLRALLLGMCKTPIFALLISSIGCFQGVRVADRAESIGQNTTRSVVLAIFFIIITDAIFSIIFSKLKL